MAEITLNEVWKRYPDGFEAVKNVNLEIGDGEFMILVGPSGCGKSTALRMIAGLEDITEGDLIIGGERVNDLAPRDRDIAMVFQNYALYPHMTVRDNMGFALEAGEGRQGHDRSEGRPTRPRSWIWSSIWSASRPNLSGGQRQRVAMGRAIVRDPRAFLMDEPLSNLDAKLRVQMRTEVSRIQRRLGTTMVYVTHDQTEAMTLGDRVAVMRAGILQQVDTPANLYEDPINLFVAGFIGSPSMNFLPGRIEGDVVKMPFGEARLPDKVKAGLARTRGRCRDVIVGMRPEHFEDATIDAGNLPSSMKFRVKADVVESMGSEKFVYFDVATEHVESAELTELAADAGMEDLPSHGEGQQVVARLSPKAPSPPATTSNWSSTPARSSCSPPTTATASAPPPTDPTTRTRAGGEHTSSPPARRYRFPGARAGGRGLGEPLS